MFSEAKMNSMKLSHQFNYFVLKAGRGPCSVSRWIHQDLALRHLFYKASNVIQADVN